MRRWITVVVTVLAVLDAVVLAVGYRARGGALPSWTIPEPRFSIGSSQTVAPTEAPTVSISGTVLLTVDAGGLVLRATRGACEERFDNPARVAVGRVGTDDELVTADLPGVAEVLGVASLPEDHLRVSGLDENCEPITLDSTDAGASWLPLEQAAIWRLDPDTTAASVTGPRGASIPLDCIPELVSNLAGLRAAVSCSAQAYVVEPRSEPVPLALPGFEQVSVTQGPTDDRYYVFGPTTDCVGRVAAVRQAGQALTNLACLDDDSVPLGIAAAGAYVVVQKGDAVLVSDDDGETFVGLDTLVAG